MADASGTRLSSSFRDPSGFVFSRNGALYRQINQCYAVHYALLHDSGLYNVLTEKGLLVPHEEVDVVSDEPENAFKVIAPQRIPFISYPYEWPFSALKDAALATLEIHRMAIEHGMVLKDASAFNIQFLDGKPVHIDTLSFEKYEEGRPWVAYQQFCKHFLAPLALMACRDIRFGLTQRAFIDGLPLDFTSKALPWHTRFRPGLLLHIHLHTKSQASHANDAVCGSDAKPIKGKLSRMGMLGLIDSLKSTVRKLRWNPPGTEWGAYYDATNYSDSAMDDKQRAVEQFLDKAQPAVVWDLGANNGRFSRIASGKGIFTASFDIDPVAVEENYRECVRNKERHLLPLLQDLTNPSPALGWAHCERDALIQRGPADMVMALALVHHLAISNNVPLGRLAAFFAQNGKTLIIEFVPKSDSQVRRLLATREDIFPGYTQEGFESAFAAFFSIDESRQIEGTERTLYLMSRKLIPNSHA